MTKNELVLCCAIRRANLGGGDRPTSAQRIQAALAVIAEWVAITGDTVFPFTVDDVEQWSIALRKSKEAQVKVDIAIAHGAECFFSKREKGPCSDEIEAGHIVPRCKGGLLSVENGQIECRAHNNQRREMSIEAYLQSNLSTKQLQEDRPDGLRAAAVTVDSCRGD